MPVVPDILDLPAPAAPPRTHCSPALERLVVAAVSNPRIARALLARPATLVRWHGGMSVAEQALAAAITDAPSLADYAGRLHACLAAGALESSTPHSGPMIGRRDPPDERQAP